MCTLHFVARRALLYATLTLPLLFSQSFALAEPVEVDDPTVEILVTARKWEEPLRRVPASMEVQSRETLAATGVESVSDAAHQVVNLTEPDFSARWLNFPYVRGIGSGRNSPAVTTLIDGVPQLSYATSNLILLDVDRVEFLRGPQGALYGRGALGGVINVVQGEPGDQPATWVTTGTGSASLRDLRGGFSGPLGGAWRGGISAGTTSRDGFTTNDVTGNRLDDRDGQAVFAQVQRASGAWTTRLSFTGERDRDGDYALGDLGAQRAMPFHVAHDFEGSTRRDVAQPVLTMTRAGATTQFTSITAWQWWRERDRTDADFSPLDLMRSGSDEAQQAWIQEFRYGTAPGAEARMRWLVGLFAYTSIHDQDRLREFSAAAAAGYGVPFAFTQHDTARLHNLGLSPYAQANLSLGRRAALTLGLRHDYERKEARLLSYTDPAMPSPPALDLAHDFNQTSPQAALTVDLNDRVMLYASGARGYKAGGFNAQAPAGLEVYEDESSQSVEVGARVRVPRRHLDVDACLFRTTWRNIQLDVPGVIPGVFYIDNAGRAVSQGGEVTVTARPRPNLEYFAGLGILDTAFGAGSQSNGADVSDHRLPFAPALTWKAGVQLARPLGHGWQGGMRLDVRGIGKYYYDALNAAAQPAYVLTDLRLTLGRGPVQIEGWARNLFDARYQPVAFAVPLPTVPSGYVAESGAPRTIGVTLRYRYP